MPKFGDNGKTLSNLTFDNKRQHNLFMLYLEKTEIQSMKNQNIKDLNSKNQILSLKDFYTPNIGTNPLNVILKQTCGVESLVSKFMEITRMMEMNYTEHMIATYEIGKDPSNLPLQRHGKAIIPKEVLEEMQKYRQEVPEKLEKTIKQTLDQYQSHLRQKLLNEAVINNIDSSIDIGKIRKGILTAKQEKLLKRYEAINTVYNHVKDKSSLDKDDHIAIQKAVKTCQNNKPAWSERSFLQKLTDLLSVGLKPLYRSFFSKEKQFEEKLQKESFPTLK